MRTLCALCLLMTSVFALLACSAQEGNPTDVTLRPVTPANASNGSSQRPLHDPLDPKPRTELERWRDAALEATSGYESYTRVADYPLWAPTLCSAPAPTVQFMSKAEGGRAHAQKLYFLWVKDGQAYSAKNEPAKEMPQPSGQIIVKETFLPVEGQGGIKAEGKEYKAGERGPLFLMMRFEPGTEGTDEGWVYATLSPDGKQVTSAGRLDSCMGCHVEAGDDRVFGVKADWSKED
jgi:hypothetical protein